MDGVLTRPASSWGYVHERLRTADDGSLARYIAGEIDDEEFIRCDVKRWMEARPGLKWDTIVALLDEVEMTRGFHETMEALEVRGIKRAMISGGLEPLAARLAEAGGIHPALANSVVVDGEGNLTGEGVVNVLVRRKGVHVPQVLETLGLDEGDGTIVAVGDSFVDGHMFRRCDLGIAFNPYDERVKEHARAVVPGGDLQDILPHIP